MTQTRQNEKNNELTTPSRTPLDISSLATQLATLMAWARAMSLKQPLTDAQADVHMEEWGQIALEVGFGALEAAVHELMRNDTDWFPSVKAIRERVGLKREDRLQVEVNAAWDWVLQYISRHWHPDLGSSRNAPAVPPRIAYAVHQVGGWRKISMRTYESEPFMRRDFAEAYRLAPLANEMQAQLTTCFEQNTLAGGLKELAAAKAMR